MRLFATWARCAWCRQEPTRLWVPTVVSGKRKVGFCSSRCADACKDNECKQIEVARKQRQSRSEELERAWHERNRFPSGGD